MPNLTKAQKTFWDIWGPWIRWVLPIAGGTILWFTRVEARLEKAEGAADNAPSALEVQQKIDEAISKSNENFNSAIQPIREDVREIKTNVEWLKRQANR